MDPLSIGKVILSVAGIARQGYEAIKRRFPGYGRFWGKLARKLEHDPHLDWEQFEQKCRIEPEFVGSALGLMLGTPGSRDRMEAHLQFIQSKGEGFEDRQEVIERILVIAEAAAYESVNDEDRLLYQRRLIEETVERVGEEGRDHTASVVEDATVRVEAGIADLGERLDELSEGLTQPQTPGQSPEARQQKIAELEAILTGLDSWKPEDKQGEEAKQQAREKGRRLSSSSAPKKGRLPLLTPKPSSVASPKRSGLSRSRRGQNRRTAFVGLKRPFSGSKSVCSVSQTPARARSPGVVRSWTAPDKALARPPRSC